MNGQVYSDGLGDAISIAVSLVFVLAAYYIGYKHPKRERKKLNRRKKCGIFKTLFRRKKRETPARERFIPTECKANCLMAVYYQTQLQEEQERYKKDIAQLEENYAKKERQCELLQDTITKLRIQNHNKQA